MSVKLYMALLSRTWALPSFCAPATDTLCQYLGIADGRRNGRLSSGIMPDGCTKPFSHHEGSADVASLRGCKAWETLAIGHFGGLDAAWAVCEWAHLLRPRVQVRAEDHLEPSVRCGQLHVLPRQQADPYVVVSTATQPPRQGDFGAQMLAFPSVTREAGGNNVAFAVATTADV